MIIPVESSSSLESLTIKECKTLRSPPRCLPALSHLTHLIIWECPELEIEEEEFPPFPITLKSFYLIQCLKIKSIAVIPNNLTELHITACPALEMEEFPPLPITLSSFGLAKCPKIRGLPNQWHHLPSLYRMYIKDCPSIECFPKGGFPPNLEFLVIDGCEGVKEPVREWGLPSLTSLQSLGIDGISMGGEGEKVCFPSQQEEDNDEDNAWSLLFPSSLTQLIIYDMREVERLASGLRTHLSSLRVLENRDCPKLRELPEDGLPPSLQLLSIGGCSDILKDGCSKLTGHYWPLLQHIPIIKIDGDRIW